jgi:hypothetical protein
VTAIESASGQAGADSDVLRHRFSEAADRAGGIIEGTYCIGGAGFRLRYAGPALHERFSPSLEHLRVPAGALPPDGHVVELWDGSSTGTDAPPSPSGVEDLGVGGIATGSGPAWRAVYEGGVRTMSVIDEREDRSWFWAATAATLPEWYCSTPLRHILHDRLSSRGVQLVHAGAVGRPDGGVVIVGKSGSGKSTSTLSTLGSELGYAGDDYVGVSVGATDDRPFVHSVYGCGKLETVHLIRFPQLRFAARPERPGSAPAAREKTIFYVRDTYPEQLTKGFPLKAIVVPRVTPNKETNLRTIPLTVALRALIPGTMFEIQGAGQDALSALIRFASRVETFELQLGTGLERVPVLLEDALARLG